ncbi:hypothetical protein GCM10027280_25610 [Micromonospora polyrhachis]
MYLSDVGASHPIGGHSYLSPVLWSLSYLQVERTVAMLYGRPISLIEHRRDWRTLGRRCVCGLRWPCPDRHPFPGEGMPRVSAAFPVCWNAPTTLFDPISRAGSLTRAQNRGAQGYRPRHGAQ